MRCSSWVSRCTSVPFKFWKRVAAQICKILPYQKRSFVPIRRHYTVGHKCRNSSGFAATWNSYRIIFLFNRWISPRLGVITVTFFPFLLITSRTSRSNVELFLPIDSSLKNLQLFLWVRVHQTANFGAKSPSSEWWQVAPSLVFDFNSFANKV